MLIVAGPCALLPDTERMARLAKDLRDAGANVFRAGACKGGTFPPAIGSPVWGVGMQKAAPVFASILDWVGMESATEVSTAEQADYADDLAYWWTPARQMQNYMMVRMLARRCLSRAGQRTVRDLWIKRGPGCPLREIAGIIEHVNQVGYPLNRLWIIERGIVGLGFDAEVRWRPDLMIARQIKELYPTVRVMFDASHSTGRREYVTPMSVAAVGAGFDGLMIECMDDPEQSPSDARQTIDIPTFVDLARKVRAAVKSDQPSPEVSGIKGSVDERNRHAATSGAGNADMIAHDVGKGSPAGAQSDLSVCPVCGKVGGMSIHECCQRRGNPL